MHSGVAQPEVPTSSGQPTESFGLSGLMAYGDSNSDEDLPTAQADGPASPHQNPAANDTAASATATAGLFNMPYSPAPDFATSGIAAVAASAQGLQWPDTLNPTPAPAHGVAFNPLAYNPLFADAPEVDANPAAASTFSGTAQGNGRFAAAFKPTASFMPAAAFVPVNFAEETPADMSWGLPGHSTSAASWLPAAASSPFVPSQSEQAGTSLASGLQSGADFAFSAVHSPFTAGGFQAEEPGFGVQPDLDFSFDAATAFGTGRRHDCAGQAQPNNVPFMFGAVDQSGSAGATAGASRSTGML